ncbi:T9SS type A sorting domain-containing protein [Paucihalobacter ruber]|uniref:T9SS type A sorting domain-containing protein n=1 Tax=Paucihalobacter ruber TaxID=2567861 RepID=A0A506PPG2_9FLAO|nr:autotransporter-associated beta strand repeat-containing protein [Paucihalobacter ruber]TPV35763.1 T9SS type A sorting domain-containing protein [Paucihalobacter ruber]
MNKYLVSIAAVFFCIVFSYGQTQQIFWRSEAVNGEWFEANPCGEIGTSNSQWFYPHFGGNTSRNAPNCFGIYDLVFGNNHELIMNNSESFFNINRITFDGSNTNTRTLNGQGIDLRNEGINIPIIRNLSVGSHIINIPIALQNSPVEFNPVNGNLTFSNTIFNNGNFIDVFGNNGNILRLSGNVQGTGGIALKQNSIIEIAGAMTYTGGTAIEAGTLRIEAGGDLSNDTAVTISSSATFDLNDQSITVRSVSETASGNGGTVDLGSGTLTVAGGWSGELFQNTITGSGNIVKNGSGTWSLYGTNTYSGTTTINGGTLKLLNSSPNSDITIETGGTLIIEGSSEITVKSVNIQSGGLLQINGGQSLKITGDLINNGTVNLSLSLGGDLKVGGNFTQNGILTNNGRAVFFDGTGAQTVTGSSLPLSFDYVRVDKSGTTLSFAEDVVVTQVNGGVGYEQTNGIVTVAAGKSLTVQNGGNFDIVAGTFTLESNSTSYSSLIVNNVTNTGGSIQYNRYTNAIGSGTTGGNDLVAPPLGGQAFGAFATTNDGVLAASGDLRAFAPFNNGANPGAYQNYNVVTDAATALQAGQGYRAAAGATLLFTGDVTTGNLSVGITAPTGTFGEWNLIGNPYPSYIDIGAFLNHAASGTSNIDLMKNASGIYGYDGVATDGWDVITLANAGTRLMAPGQGFFVAADADESLEFTPAMRRTGSSDDFIPGRSAPLTYLKLKASNGQQSYKTDFYFNQNATTGFDAGYDARTWGNQSSGFILYSHLVTDNTGIPMALQALGMDDLNDVSIPLGINAASGSTLEFSILESQLPTNTQVYLEDLTNNTITSITNTSYSVNLNQPVSGTGRFFLRFTTGTLGIGDDTANSLNIYHDAAAQNIVIAGQLSANTQAYLYDLQGRAVSATALSAAQLDQRIDVSSLSSGVYVLSFDNGNTRISKKLMIR